MGGLGVLETNVLFQSLLCGWIKVPCTSTKCHKADWDQSNIQTTQDVVKAIRVLYISNKH